MFIKLKSKVTKLARASVTLFTVLEFVHTRLTSVLLSLEEAGCAVWSLNNLKVSLRLHHILVRNTNLFLCIQVSVVKSPDEGMVGKTLEASVVMLASC